MAHQLIIRDAGQVSQTVSLERDLYTIGRLPDNDLVLSGNLISRYHAELRRSGAVYMITDLGSSNGTMLDGSRLLPQEPRPLAHGSQIIIGTYTLIFAAEANGDDAQIEILAVAEQVVAPAQPIAAPMPVPVLQPPRSTYPAPRAGADGDKASFYLHYLPSIFQDSDFLGRFLMIFQTLWEPLETRQDHIDMYFDPRTCPASFLPWLASWLDVPVNPYWPEARQRRLLAEAMDIYRWRGTRYGLVRMIEVCTGLAPDIRDDPVQPFVVQINVHVPEGAQVDRMLIEELIRNHKPAHTAYILTFH